MNEIITLHINSNELEESVREFVEKKLHRMAKGNVENVVNEMYNERLKEAVKTAVTEKLKKVGFENYVKKATEEAIKQMVKEELLVTSYFKTQLHEKTVELIQKTVEEVIEKFDVKNLIEETVNDRIRTEVMKKVRESLMGVFKEETK